MEIDVGGKEQFNIVKSYIIYYYNLIKISIVLELSKYNYPEMN